MHWRTLLTLGVVASASAYGCAADEQAADCTDGTCDELDGLSREQLETNLISLLEKASKNNRPKEYQAYGWVGKRTEGIDMFRMPHPGDPEFGGDLDKFYAAIPADPKNKITKEKVELGRMLYHDPMVLSDPKGDKGAFTASCSTCHIAEVQFRPGIRHGIGEGGEGFGDFGRNRVRRADYSDGTVKVRVDHNPSNGADIVIAAGTPSVDCLACDLQDRSPPTVINAAWQLNRLWNGALGLGGFNGKLTADKLKDNALNVLLGMQGVETESIAALLIHRHEHPLAGAINQPVFRALLDAAYPNGESDIDVGFLGDELFKLMLKFKQDMPREERTLLFMHGLSISAFTRSLLANEAPFQRWLRGVKGQPNGDRKALNDEQLRGANLFFGKAGCVRCHTGPPLATPGFFAVGFHDLGDIRSKQDAVKMGKTIPDFLPDTAFVTQKEKVPTSVDPRTGVETFDTADKGRGGFTGDDDDNFKFKPPTLYNLKDVSIMGHGGSFFSVEDVVRYFNAAKPENLAADASGNIAEEFTPLGLTESEIKALVAFIEQGLRDPDLTRYRKTPTMTSMCFTDSDNVSQAEPRCAGTKFIGCGDGRCDPPEDAEICPGDC